MAEQKILLGNVRGPKGDPGPNTLSSSTTTSGFENGYVLYNNNGKVGSKKLLTSDVQCMDQFGVPNNYVLRTLWNNDALHFIIRGYEMDNLTNMNVAVHGLLGDNVNYVFPAHKMQCLDVMGNPNGYSLRSLYKNDGMYHLGVYSEVDGAYERTFSDFAGQISSASSIRYKEDIRQVEDDLLEKMLGLQVIDFRYGEQAPEYVRDEKRHFGMIAEEVAEVMPNSVMLDQEELPTAVVYSDFIPLLLAQLQRQQKKLSALEQRIQKLEESKE